ncbi:hypothetical protein OSTOST_20945 [Ostertagia ostertagi]
MPSSRHEGTALPWTIPLRELILVARLDVGERSLSKSPGKRPSDFSTSVRSSRSRRDSSMDSSRHGGDSMSVSISRRKPRTKV